MTLVRCDDPPHPWSRSHSTPGCRSVGRDQTDLVEHAVEERARFDRGVPQRMLGVDAGSEWREDAPWRGMAELHDRIPVDLAAVGWRDHAVPARGDTPVRDALQHEPRVHDDMVGRRRDVDPSVRGLELQSRAARRVAVR